MKTSQPAKRKMTSEDFRLYKELEKLAVNPHNPSICKLLDISSSTGSKFAKARTFNEYARERDNEIARNKKIKAMADEMAQLKQDLADLRQNHEHPFSV